MLDPASIERGYQEQGLTTAHVVDEPGKVYESHGHEQTRLYTLAGSVAIKIEDNPAVTLQPEEEFVVGSGQIHEAVVGDDGWEYVAAWDPVEAKQYPHEG